VAKRFKKTATGKLKYHKVGRRHLAGSKSRARKRNLRKAGILSASFEKQLRSTLD
jgi:large subunit ribosomal protein L35